MASSQEAKNAYALVRGLQTRFVEKFSRANKFKILIKRTFGGFVQKTPIYEF